MRKFPADQLPKTTLEIFFTTTQPRIRVPTATVHVGLRHLVEPGNVIEGSQGTSRVVKRGQNFRRKEIPLVYCETLHL
jgi:hypothetical protein